MQTEDSQELAARGFSHVFCVPFSETNSRVVFCPFVVYKFIVSLQAGMPPEEPKQREHEAHSVGLDRQESFPPPDYPPPPPPVDVEEMSASVIEAHKPEKSTDWVSIYVASFLAVCGAVQTSLYWSSLWPYLQVVSDISY